MKTNLNAPEKPVTIIGAGPAGLSAAYELSKSGICSDLFESDSVVGGISRTAEYKGFLFDIGGHRFFTKVTAVEQMWHEVLGNDLLQRPRLSRIYFNSLFFNYPLKLDNVIGNLGPFESLHCALSYLWAQCRPQHPEKNFETWVSNRFGKRLYSLFFKSYTEKVWGIPCTEIQAEWAAQRIKGLSLSSAVWNAIRPKRGAKADAIKTLIHEFEYPRLGPGMMWNRTRDLLLERGCKLYLNSPVTRICWQPGSVTAIEVQGRILPVRHLLSSMPIRNLLQALDPAPSVEVAAAADDFNYRDFLTVALIIRKKDLFPDNWIYIHDQTVKVGRIQNFKNWSPEMVPDPDYTCLGLEYFCFEGDDLWTTADADLIELAKSEIAKLGLAQREDIVDGTVVRMPKAYPVYDGVYKRGLATVRDFLKQVPNLQLIGRNGMHHYNNQDHSMLTGMLAARNISGANFDLWLVNADGDYHEEGKTYDEGDLRNLQSTQPRVPQVVSK